MATQLATGPIPTADLTPDSRVLDNGLRVLCTPMPHTRSVTVSFYVGAGARYESEALAGISHLVEHCVFKGTAEWPEAADISIAIEGVGGVINAATDRELTVYYAKVPAPQLDVALDVVLDLACRPLFDQSELEKERQVILEELAAVEDSPGQLAGLAMDALMWANTPLGRDIAGTPASVSAIPHADTVNYWRNQYSPGNAVVSLAGALDPSYVAERVAERTAKWDFGVPTGLAPAPLSMNGERVASRRKDTEQTHLVVGLPTVSAEHPDRYALALLTGILGDGMSSRLFLRVREELGLVYDVHAYGTAMQDSGALNVYLAVDPDRAVEALRATLKELARMREGVATEELERARRYINGRMLLQLEDTRAVSGWNGGQELLRGEVKTVDEVSALYEAVSADDLARVANEYINEDHLRLSAVGPHEDGGPFGDALRLDG